MSVNCTSLGKRISFYRSKSNLSQEALAAKINCSREHIVRIENGTKIPSISVLVEIANTLGQPQHQTQYHARRVPACTADTASGNANRAERP